MTNQQRYQWAKAVWNIPWLILTLFVLAGMLIIDEQPEEQEEFETVRSLLAGNGNGNGDK